MSRNDSAAWAIRASSASGIQPIASHLVAIAHATACALWNVDIDLLRAAPEDLWCCCLLDL